jgi:hypothetical protein
MSICSETYWFYYNGNALGNNAENQVDPTETIVEWLVEMRKGQLDIFTYDHNNIDSKNTVKVIACQIDLENQVSVTSIMQQGNRFYFENYKSKVPSRFLEILSPPPDIVL